MMELTDIITGVQTLTLKPDDVLVLLSPNRLSRIDQEAIVDQMKQILPGQKCIVLEEGMTIARLTKETPDGITG